MSTFQGNSRFANFKQKKPNLENITVTDSLLAKLGMFFCLKIWSVFVYICLFVSVHDCLYLMVAFAKPETYIEKKDHVRIGSLRCTPPLPTWAKKFVDLCGPSTSAKFASR